MPFPNYTVGLTPPLSPAQGDLWYDSTNNQINAYNGSAFVPITAPSIPAKITGSLGAAAVNPGGFLPVPLLTGSLGMTVAGMAPNMAYLAYDPTANRMWMVGSGGTFKSSAFA